MTTREVARIVGCLDAYVRVVARQRIYNGMSPADRRYQCLDTGDRAAARIAGQSAYQSELSSGSSRAERMRAYGKAWRKAMRDTGR